MTSIERGIRLRFKLRIGQLQRKRPAELLRGIEDSPDRADAAASDRRNIVFSVQLRTTRAAVRKLDAIERAFDDNGLFAGGLRQREFSQPDAGRPSRGRLPGSWHRGWLRGACAGISAGDVFAGDWRRIFRAAAADGGWKNLTQTNVMTITMTTKMIPRVWSDISFTSFHPGFASAAAAVAGSIRIRHGIESAFIERIAAQQAPQGERGAAARAV